MRHDRPTLDEEVATRALAHMGAHLDTVRGGQRCRFVRLPLEPTGGAA